MRKHRSQFAVSEHEFLERLESEDSDVTRKHLEEMSYGGTETTATAASTITKKVQAMLTELETFIQRHPISATSAALLLGLAAGMWIRTPDD
jgi:hypothetical protein